MKVSAVLIKELRAATGAGIKDVKNALVAAEGDYDAAVDILRKKGLARAAKRAGREAKEGMVKLYAHPGDRMGVVLELNCETDFVARNDMFKQLAHDLALHIAAMNPMYLNKDQVPQDDLDREVGVLRDQALAQGKPAAIVDKIVSGRINKFYEETCLLEQGFVKDDSIKVHQLISNAVSMLGENIVLRRFMRYELGESV